MTKINPLIDAESRRQQKNMTNSQRKVNNSLKEGVIVNSFYKETPQSIDLHDTYDALIISQDAQMPSKLLEKESSKEKNLLPISALVVGVMGAVALMTAFVRRSAKINLSIDQAKRLPATTRNVALNEETHQAIYQMVQAPNQKTILAGAGVLTLTAMAFMGKTFLDGFKDVWIKRKEADIQKDLQENLIDVETQSFSGKMQIIRGMLSKRAGEFEKYLADDNEPILPNFGRKKLNPLSFMGAEQNKEKNKNSNLKYIALGLGTFASIVGLGFVAMRNLTKGKIHLDKYINDTKGVINEIVSSSTDATKEIDKVNLKNLFQVTASSPAEITETLKGLKWSPEEINKFTAETINEVMTSTTKVNEAMGGNGSPKPAFYSHVDDYRAFLYNWLLDTSNPQFKQLFFGITGVTALSYGGKLVGDAIKDVQVKKINAQTELELQQRLVSTELRNFKSKKDAAIQPLVDEFYKQVDAGKSKPELKTMAENILFEIKNGAPFVYS
ncbi:MAG: hypothetical protein E7Z93_04720 [Cyanobacteria bacterium SIG32]|nr:hypothetical protein [Cyanobacteria bacterium SIG32]